MAALSLALSNVTTRSVGNRKQGTATLTLTASTSTYTTGGVSMPTGWRNTLGCPNTIDFHALSGPMMLATPVMGLVAHIDLTTNKLILFGGATTAAEDTPLEELLDSTVSISDGSYTCKLMTQGV